jgi:hypothetical protein
MNTGVRKISRNGLLAFVAFGVILLVGGRMYPQVVGATLFGTVMDQSGAAIPNAQVSIKNVATGVTRNIAADTAAFYTATNLLPGNYEITVAAPGFATQVRTDITLEVGAQQVLNITMQVGQVTQKVQVTGEVPTVQLAISSMSAVVNSTMVRELAPEWEEQPPGQCRPQYSDRARHIERGFFRVQKQLHQVHLGKLQRAVPGGDFQYSEPWKFRCAGITRPYGNLRFQRGADRGCGIADLDDNRRAADSVRSEVDLVTE